MGCFIPVKFLCCRPGSMVSITTLCSSSLRIDSSIHVLGCGNCCRSWLVPGDASCVTNYRIASIATLRLRSQHPQSSDAETTSTVSCLCLRLHALVGASNAETKAFVLTFHRGFLWGGYVYIIYNKHAVTPSSPHTSAIHSSLVLVHHVRKVIHYRTRRRRRLRTHCLCSGRVRAPARGRKGQL